MIYIRLLIPSCGARAFLKNIYIYMINPSFRNPHSSLWPFYISPSSACLFLIHNPVIITFVLIATSRKGRETQHPTPNAQCPISGSRLPRSLSTSSDNQHHRSLSQVFPVVQQCRLNTSGKQHAIYSCSYHAYIPPAFCSTNFARSASTR